MSNNMIPWTDEELDALAQITDEDIEIAKGLWRLGVAPRYRNLLDAKPAEEENLPPAEPPPPGINNA